MQNPLLAINCKTLFTISDWSATVFEINQQKGEEIVWESGLTICRSIMEAASYEAWDAQQKKV